MIAVLLVFVAALAYLLGTVNGPALIARLVFHENIHRVGNGQANIANFRKYYEPKWTAAVIGVDVAKTAVAVLLGALLMTIPGQGFPTAGKFFAGFCCVLGDLYPWREQFRGGKGITCVLVTLWLADWRVGLVASAVLIIVLAFAQYLSLAQLCACVAAPLAAWVFVDAAELKGLCGCLALFMAIVIAWRHRASIVRLAEHREPKVRWGKRPEARLREEDF